MIYLIDDKKERQVKDYNWSSQKLDSYYEVLKPIYNLEELQENKIKVFKDADVILYHESFIDKSIINNEAAQKRKKLTEYAKKKDKYLVYFSGGSDTRQIEGNIAHISDAILYQNLEYFLKAYEKGELNLEYLLYGVDPKLEEKLKKKQAELLNDTEKEEVKEITGKQNLFLRPIEDFISNPILNSDNYTLWEASDKYISDLVVEKLKENVYDNIFIPLCFGETLSDFNGLKLAIHIRCTKTINQCSNLYIYGFVNFNFLVNHSYFDILKTKNIKLIGFSKQDIYNSASLNEIKLTTIELPQEISKIKLKPPKNYYDNHSLANEWAIHRWSKTINISDERIEVIENKIENNLYFKFLKTVYPITSANAISDDKLKINYIGKPKVLYIDDEVEKGWDEVLSYLFIDKNKIDKFDYLIEDFKNINQEKLIKNAIKKIKDDDIDLVLLDFRLLPIDFKINKIEEITGVKLLKEIKKLNPGIQVIIFSATNKVWNLQTLLEAGADGFISKESPENSFDSDFSKQSILNMIHLVEDSLKKSFLKKIYKLLKPILELVECSVNKKAKNYNLNIQQPNIVKYKEYLESANYILSKSPNELKYSFLQLILIVEDIIKSFYISDSVGNHIVEVSIYERAKCILFENNVIKLSLKPKVSNKLNEFLLEDCSLDRELDKDLYKLFKNASDRIPFNYRLHSVLYYRYGLSLEDCVKFSDLYRLRSSSVAHMGKRNVGFEDLMKTFELLQILIK